ncbi:MAG: mechanosensitive ion channel [Lachnospiraceae bacterium]|nr:mechanosensitive ion channel [Lachnospiraceae bacterium]
MLDNILTNKVTVGLAETIVDNISEEVNNNINMGVIEKFLQELPEKALQIGIRVVFAAIFFLIGVQVIKLIRKILKKSLHHANADKGVIQFLDSFVKASLYVILVFVIANSFGLDATSVVAVLGSAGVAIGLAIQGSLSNFAGGVIILLVKPFRVGDYIIEDNKKNEGVVSAIELFYTKLITADEKVIVLPNGTLANTSITNVTATYKRRLDIHVGISYSADLRKAKKVMEELIQNDEAVLKDQEMLVVVEELGNSAVVLSAKIWVKNEDYFAAKWRLNETVKLRFDEVGIEIPYDQLDVHIRKE